MIHVYKFHNAYIKFSVAKYLFLYSEAEKVIEP